MQASDPELYESVSNYVKNENPINSAYRSGLIVKLYKKKFKERYEDVEPYLPLGSSFSKLFREPTGLTRWFSEKWTNQRGKEGYQTPRDVYRPSKRITKDTPITWDELTDDMIKEAQKQKFTVGRVKNFKQGSGILSDKEKYLSQFIPIQMKKAREQGLDFIDRIEVSPIKNKKYRVFLKPDPTTNLDRGGYVDYGFYGTLASGKESEDFLEHGDEDRQYKFHQRWKNNSNRDNVFSPVFYILRLNW